VLAELEAARTKVGNLEIALATSRRIGMAIGVVMSEFKVTEDQAFAALIKASQTRHKKVRDVAEDVVLTGTIQGSAEG
jgi:AmiR/NasT family two-component response regulator